MNHKQDAFADAPRSPVLRVCRRCRNRPGPLVERSDSTHPAERFGDSTVLRRDREAGAR